MKIIEGNLFLNQEYKKYDYIIHLVNIYQSFGIGNGKYIKKLFPEILKIELKNSKYGSLEKLGCINFTTFENETNIIALCCKPDYSNEIIDYASFEYGVEKINSIFGGKSLSFALHKADNSDYTKECDWSIIEKILEKNFKNENINVYDFKENGRNK